MNILVSNDDGVLAPGIALLADVCREVGNVTVVAPDREQSGTSHSLTLHRPLRPMRRPDVAGNQPETMATYRPLLLELVERITRVHDFPEQMLLNINLPRIPASEVKGIQVTKLGSRYFSESLTRMKDPWGREIFWIGGGTITWTGGENSDHLAVAEGFVSVTPLHMDLTNYSLLETVRGWSLEG
ncbi:MAG: hypothetical protein K0S19_286 [Geminicoccaceae bacterium]|nr:hypothetical protein [Geminicoccaceae bacterium]